MSQEISKLKAVHREIIRLHCLGMRPQEIADQLGLSYHAVWSLLNSPLAKAHIQQIQANQDAYIIEASNSLKELAPRCVEVLREIMEDQVEVDLRTKLNTSFQILDRVGLGRINKIHSISQTLTQQDIEEIKSRARNIAPDIIEESTITDTSGDSSGLTRDVSNINEC